MTDSERPPGGLDRPHSGHGRFVSRIETAKRNGEAARLRSRGLSYQEIADQLGYASKGAAHDGVRRALQEAVQEGVDELRQVETSHLLDLRRAALAVMEAHHVVVSNGRVVYLGEQPLTDTGPVLAAISQLVRISERLSRLHGLDAPVKHDVQVTDALKAEIDELLDQMQQLDAQEALQTAARERG
jgi:hypothetical protein